MKLHTKCQRPGQSGFRQDFLSFQLKNLDVQMDRNHLNNFERDQLRIIPVKFGQNQISGLGEDVV